MSSFFSLDSGLVYLLYGLDVAWCAELLAINLVAIQAFSRVYALASPLGPQSLGQGPLHPVPPRVGVVQGFSQLRALPES